LHQSPSRPNEKLFPKVIRILDYIGSKPEFNTSSHLAPLVVVMAHVAYMQLALVSASFLYQKCDDTWK